MKKQWFRLDNAALIFPAIIRRNWNNVFRLSVTLRDPVDPEALNRAAGSDDAESDIPEVTEEEAKEAAREAANEPQMKKD